MDLFLMRWNWQQTDWPTFTYRSQALETRETQFLRRSGELRGAFRHVSPADREALTVDLMSDEALKTSEIEGELLNRDSVQSSIRRHFGLEGDQRPIPAAERGISDMIVDLYRAFQAPLSHDELFKWHRMVTGARQDLTDIGRYRTHTEPMQVISGPLHRPKIHFEAPPSSALPKEMDQFIAWFNASAPTGPKAMSSLARAGMAHLYFVCIHPFEDGNGRIGRGLAEKTLSQSLGEPTLIALSHAIESKKKRYYDALETANKDNEITDWLIYFADTVLDAQTYTLAMIDFLIEKTKLYDRARGLLNERQDRVIARMFREGPGGFKGGLSAENYITISKTSRATATRDLQSLVELKILNRKGERKSTRYFLNLTQPRAAISLKEQAGV